MIQELQDDPIFDGATFVSEFDADRLAGQMRRVFDIMRDGQWRTLGNIAKICHINAEFRHLDSESSVSARLRDLRKSRFGSFTVDRRRRGDPKSGLFEYRVTK